MTYELHMRFRPGVPFFRFARSLPQGFKWMPRGSFPYRNPDTEVEFSIHYLEGRSLLGRTVVTAATFEMNYCRPSYFALEAEFVLGSLVAQFSPAIDDPQMHGMGRGPYSKQGFLSGWNFGNAFAIRSALSRGDRLPSMPRDRLQKAWRWNYRNDAWHIAYKDAQFPPLIKYLWVDGRAAQVAAWPIGMPVVLPKVDYVLVGRMSDGERRYGLAPWDEVTAVVARAGIKADGNLLDIRYANTPDSIDAWFQQIPLISSDDYPPLDPWQVVDAEALEEASAD